MREDGWKDERRDKILLASGCATSLFVLCTALAASLRDGGRFAPPKLLTVRMVWDIVGNLVLFCEAVAMNPTTCQGTQGRALAFFTHVFLVGSEMLFAAFCVDLLYTMADPFVNAGREIRKSLTFVLIAAIGSGLALIVNADWTGETFIPLCYTNTNQDVVGVSLLNLAFFYIPVLACYFLSIVTSVHAAVVLGTRLAGFNMRSRLRTLRQLQEFVFVHGLMWGFIIVLYLPVVILVEAPWHDENEDIPLRIAFAALTFFFGARGLALLPFCFRVIQQLRSPRSRLGSVSAEDCEEKSQEPQLSKSLQRDTLHFLLSGVVTLLSGRGEIDTSLDQRSAPIAVPNQLFTIQHPDPSRFTNDDSIASGVDLSESLLSLQDGGRRTSLQRSQSSSVFRTMEVRRKEVLLAIKVISPMVIACSLSVIVSIFFKYHLQVTLLCGLGIIVALALIILVWVLSFKRLRSIHQAHIIEHYFSAFQSIRGESTSQALVKSFQESVEGQYTSNKRKIEFKVSQGRSGSFLFVTADKRWIVKTIPKSEMQVLTSILTDLAAYWKKEPNSALGRLYGLFSLKSFGRTFHLIVMENIVPTVADATFDLKGSWIDRSAAQPTAGTVYYCKHCSMPFQIGSRSTAGCRLHRTHEPRRLLKDNDFQSGKILLPLVFTINFKEQIRRDVEFLASHQIMDYSLLLGIQNSLSQQVVSLELHESNTEVVRRIANNIRSGTGVPALLLKGAAFYHLGIIDYLQKYTWSKKMERLIKSYLFCKRDRDENGFIGLSAVNPEQYKERFLKRVIDEVLVELRDLVQVARKQDLAPIAIFDVGDVSTMEQFLTMLADAAPSAKDPIFAVEWSEDDQTYQGTSLTAETFPAFLDKCHKQELTHLLVTL